MVKDNARVKGLIELENTMYQNFTKGQSVNSDEIQNMWQLGVMWIRMYLVNEYRDEFAKVKSCPFTIE